MVVRLLLRTLAQRHRRAFVDNCPKMLFTTNTTATKESICELATSHIKYGVGATSDVGYHVRDELDAPDVVLFTDKNVRRLPCMNLVMESLHNKDINVTIYDEVRVEPNDQSFQSAASFLSAHKSNRPPQLSSAIIALGGGSVIDTAKAANLLSTHPPSDFYDYVNPPIGRGLLIPPGPLLPLIAVPTTAGTGSETTGVAIFDDTPSSSKTGIADRRLRPVLGIIDPTNTQTLPPDVATYSGLDVLCHSIESYTALPFTSRQKPEDPSARPTYQGSNPISDVWALHALNLTSQYIRRVVSDPHDQEARSSMLLASTAAGYGFGNAGVQLPHGMSYPVASQVKNYRPHDDGNSGYKNLDHALVPHGHSVIACAPASFRFNGCANPERHWECAVILSKHEGKKDLSTSPSRTTTDVDYAGSILAEQILELMSDLNVPIGLSELGYTEKDVGALVRGTLPQHRVTKLSPRAVGEEELDTLFRESLRV